MKRLSFFIALCSLAWPVYAGVVDDIAAQIFEGSAYSGNNVKVKNQYRTCLGDGSCTSVLSLCRWRAVNTNSQKFVQAESDKAQLECKWPPPPATPPAVKCIERLCEIPPDGKYY